MGMEPAASNYYEILQVHPAAPLDLVTAAYWRLADRLQADRGSDSQAAAALHRLTKAYQTLADPNSRAAYDPSIGLPSQPSYPPPRDQLLYQVRQRPQHPAQVGHSPTALPLASGTRRLLMRTMLQTIFFSWQLPFGVLLSLRIITLKLV